MVRLHALDDPQLPERFSAIQLLRHDARGEPLQLADVAGLRQMGMAQVVVEVEPGVVHPDGVLEQRDPLEPLAIARDAMQPRLDAGPDAVHVDTAVHRPQRPRLEDRDGADVHVRRAILQFEKAVVEGGQPLVMGVGHTSKPPARPPPRSSEERLPSSGRR